MGRDRLGMGGVAVALLAATVGVLTVTAAPVSATTVSVANDAEYRQALTDLSADITLGPHVIDITADFTITLAGDPTYTGTQPLTINGNGHTINGGGAHSALFHNTGQALTINDLTLTNGKSTGGNSGGAILSAQGSVTVTGSTFTGNTAGGSGGAISTFGSVTATDSTFTGNAAANVGGAIVAGGSVEVTDSTFTDNTASNVGGAIYAVGSVTATDSTFTDNTAEGSGRGGAVYTDGSVTVTDSTFTGNTANNDGGAIYKFGVGLVTVTGSTFNNNTASRNNGGAIRASQSVTVTDSISPATPPADAGGPSTPSR